jgi:hypothetical protein
MQEHSQSPSATDSVPQSFSDSLVVLDDVELQQVVGAGPNGSWQAGPNGTWQVTI